MARLKFAIQLNWQCARIPSKHTHRISTHSVLQVLSPYVITPHTKILPCDWLRACVTWCIWFCLESCPNVTCYTCTCSKQYTIIPVACKFIILIATASFLVHVPRRLGTIYVLGVTKQILTAFTQAMKLRCPWCSRSSLFSLCFASGK